MEALIVWLIPMAAVQTVFNKKTTTTKKKQEHIPRGCRHLIWASQNNRWVNAIAHIPLKKSLYSCYGRAFAHAINIPSIFVYIKNTCCE